MLGNVVLDALGIGFGGFACDAKDIEALKSGRAKGGKGAAPKPSDDRDDDR